MLLLDELSGKLGSVTSQLHDVVLLFFSLAFKPVELTFDGCEVSLCVVTLSDGVILFLRQFEFLLFELMDGSLG